MVRLLVSRLEKPVRRDLDYYQNVSVETPADSICFYTTSAVSATASEDTLESLGFDAERQIVFNRLIIYCMTSSWDEMRQGSSDDGGEAARS